jgi:hypothetical protein
MKRTISIAVVIAISFMLCSNVTNACAGSNAKEASILKLDVCKKQAAVSAGAIDTLLYYEQQGININPVPDNIFKSASLFFYASHHIFTKDRPPRV